MEINNLSSTITGLLMGFIVGYANYRILKSSVSSMVSKSKDIQGAYSGLKFAVFFSFFFFLKMVVLALIFIVAIKVMNFNWIGVGAGLVLAMVVSIYMFLREKNVNNSRSC